MIDQLLVPVRVIDDKASEVFSLGLFPFKLPADLLRNGTGNQKAEKQGDKNDLILQNRSLGIQSKTICSGPGSAPCTAIEDMKYLGVQKGISHM